MVILCCARGEDARVGGGGRVCFVGFFEGHGDDSGGGVLCVVGVIEDGVQSDYRDVDVFAAGGVDKVNKCV